MRQPENVLVRGITGIPFPVLMFLCVGVAGALPLLVTGGVLIFSDFSVEQQLFVVGCGAVFGVCSNILVVKIVNIRPKMIAEEVKEIAEGSLMNVPTSSVSDAFGGLQVDLGKMVVNMRDMVAGSQQFSQLLEKESLDLDTVSRDMSEKIGVTSVHTRELSQYAEDVYQQTTSVAAAIEQSTANTNRISMAVEQLEINSNNLADETSKAEETTSKAVAAADKARSAINTLGESAREINQVTQTITEISEQTNLLALNATIEAARAGEAGKGFAVVANEIKVLAQQTADATLEINAMIEDIQNNTGASVENIEAISAVIHEVDQSVSTIRDAIHEQNRSTSEIAHNISESTQVFSAISETVADTSGRSSAMSSSAAEIDARISEIGESGKAVEKASGEMAIIAGQLKSSLLKFKVEA